MPTEIALFAFAGSEADHAGTIVVSGEQDSAFLGNIVQSEGASSEINQTLFSGKCDGAQFATGAGSGASEPDFVSVRPPGESLNADELTAKGLLVTRLVDRCNTVGVISAEGNGPADTAVTILDKPRRVVQKGDRKAGMADPSCGFVEHFAQWIFEALFAAYATDHG